MITLQGVSRTYPGGLEALKATDLEIAAGEFVTILGPSGSGKTTLLNLVAGLDRPSGGLLRVDGQELGGLSAAELLEYRRHKVALVFQHFHLLPTLTAAENIELLGELGAARRPAAEVLEAVGLADRAEHFPHQLSGGEQQRVAVARALAKDPLILLGDEPTGSLDAATGRLVLALFQQLNRQGKVVILVTHNAALARLGTRCIHLSQGVVRSDETVSSPVSAVELQW